MTDNNNASQAEKKAALAIVLAIAGTIKELGSVPSGHLYNSVMHRMSLDNYNAVIGLIEQAGMIRIQNHLITWVGK